MDKPQPNPARPLDYRASGVDIDAGNALVEAIKPLAATTARSGADAELGGFGGLFDLRAAGFRDPILVASNDGVGTKVKIAIETGRHETIGIDLVAMCVNDIVVQGAEPLFFLDYFATAKLHVDVARTVVAGIAAGCREAGCALIGGETAEMPGLYQPGDYDLAGFAVGAAERGWLLPRADIAAGDILIGIASTGLHSNGFSLVRKLAASRGFRWDEPAPFAPGLSLGEALLAPTRIYVKPLLAVLRAHWTIKALAHITGGGLVENVVRVLPETVTARIDLASIRPPGVFPWLASEGRIAEADMLRTFNCGVGMVAVAAAEAAEALIAALQTEGETAYRIGVLEPRRSSRVRFTGSLGFAA